MEKKISNYHFRLYQLELHTFGQRSQYMQIIYIKEINFVALSYK